MSTLFILTFSTFDVGSILDFVHSGFCPIRDFVQFGIFFNSGFCPIWDFVQFKILSNSGFCPFGILSIRDFVQIRILFDSGFCPIRDFFQFEIFSNSGFCPFGILSNSGFFSFGILFVNAQLHITFENEARSSFIGMTHFIQSSVLQCIFIYVEGSLPSPGSILKIVTHFLFAKIKMKLVRKKKQCRSPGLMT